MNRLSALLLLLGFTGSLRAQENKAPYSMLHVTRASLRFFPSLGAYPALEERVYPETFDSATARYISVELNLNYPSTTTSVGFKIICTYTGPNGENAGTPSVAGNIPIGWTGSFHAGGWGSKEGSSFPVGFYKVACRDGTDVVASGGFIVSRDRFDIPAIRAVVSQVRMYESPSEAIPLSERKYAGRFDAGSARALKVELGLVFPRLTASARFVVPCIFRFPDGSESDVELQPAVEAGWVDGLASGGLIPTNGWARGSYRVTCRYQDRVIAERGFTVY